MTALRIEDIDPDKEALKTVLRKMIWLLQLNHSQEADVVDDEDAGVDDDRPHRVLQLVHVRRVPDRQPVVVVVPAGAVKERRIIGIAPGGNEPCADCLRLAEMGWQPVGTLPRPGAATKCGHWCVCTMAFQLDDEAAVVGKPAEAVVPDTVKVFPQDDNGEAAQAWASQHWNADKRPESATQAIRQYKSGDGYEINQLLRTGETVEENDPEKLAELKKTGEALNDYLVANPIPEPIETYRGVNKAAFGGVVPTKDLVGQVISDKGFVSSSTRLRTATHFGNIYMTVQVPAGTPGAYIDNQEGMPGEQEVLLGTNQKLLITKVVNDFPSPTDPNDKHVMVYAQVVPTTPEAPTMTAAQKQQADEAAAIASIKAKVKEIADKEAAAAAASTTAPPPTPPTPPVAPASVEPGPPAVAIDPATVKKFKQSKEEWNHENIWPGAPWTSATVTPDEIKALQMYRDASSTSEAMSKLVREGSLEVQPGDAPIVQELKKNSQHIINVSHRITVPQNVEVYRSGSAHLFRGATDSQWSDINMPNVGDVITENGFMSTSTNKVTADHFGYIHMKITVPKGTPGVYMQNIDPSLEGENELILAPGRKFVVTSVAGNPRSDVNISLTVLPDTPPPSAPEPKKYSEGLGNAVQPPTTPAKPIVNREIAQLTGQQWTAQTIQENGQLTDEQKAAITYYTTTYDTGINQSLRYRAKNGEPYDPQDNPMAEAISSALQSHPLPESAVLTRWTSIRAFGGTQDAYGKIHGMQDLVGKTVVEPGFTSTDLIGEEAGKLKQIHIDNSTNESVFMVINAPKGTPAMYVDTLSAHQKEKDRPLEVLIDKNTHFLVTSVEQQIATDQHPGTKFSDAGTDYLKRAWVVHVDVVNNPVTPGTEGKEKHPRLYSPELGAPVNAVVPKAPLQLATPEEGKAWAEKNWPGYLGDPSKYTAEQIDALNTLRQGGPATDELMAQMKRGGTPRPPDPTSTFNPFPHDYNPEIKQINDLIGNNTVPADVTLSKTSVGITWSQGGTVSQLTWGPNPERLVGQVIQDPSFISIGASSKPKGGGSENDIFTLDVPKGTSGVYVGDAGETGGYLEGQNVVLGGGQKYMITSVTRRKKTDGTDGDGWDIRAKIVDPATPVSGPLEVTIKKPAPGEYLTFADAYEGDKWGTENYPLDSFTPQEQKVIHAYTGLGARPMNYKLRTGKKHPEALMPEGWTIPQMTSQLDQALNNHPLPENVVVSRIVDTTQFPELTPEVKAELETTAKETGRSIDQLVADRRVQDAIGKTFIDKGFMSTSAGTTISGISGWEDAVQLEIHAPKGTPSAYVVPMSNYKEQYELLLGRNLHYTVTGATRVGKGWRVDIQVLPDPTKKMVGTETTTPTPPTPPTPTPPTPPTTTTTPSIPLPNSAEGVVAQVNKLNKQLADRDFTGLMSPEEVQNYNALSARHESLVQIGWGSARKDTPADQREAARKEAVKLQAQIEAVDVRAHKTAQAKARGMVQVPDPIPLDKITYVQTDLPSDKPIEDGLTQLAGIVSDKVFSSIPGRPIMQFAALPPEAKGRSYFQNNQVFIPPNEKPDIVDHEVGHWLEKHVPGWKQKAQDFLGKQTILGADHKPQVITLPGFNPSETFYKTRFHDPYAGKIYSDGSTEVISVGIQNMISNPSYFAQSDPEYFKFIYDLLRSAT